MRTVILFALFAFTCFAQDKPPDAPKEPPKYVAPSVRMKEAKTIYVKNAGGSEIPYNVIDSGVVGWGKYIPVDSPEKADLVVEISAPYEDSGVSVTSSTSTESGHKETKTTSTKDLTVPQIKLVVLDGRNHVPLWTAVERPKGGFRQKTRDDNLVEASQRLMHQFRERVEGPSQAEPSSK